MSGLKLKLKPGGIIRHNKRGSEYEVCAITRHVYFGKLRDGHVSRFCKEFGIIAHVQRSNEATEAEAMVVTYRALTSKPGEPWLFWRDINEFTDNRFELVAK